MPVATSPPRRSTKRVSSSSSTKTPRKQTAYERQLRPLPIISTQRSTTNMNTATLVQLFGMIPQLVRAVQSILASNAGQTLEGAIQELVKHVTPGQPNSPALAPSQPSQP